jgi:hypothetical protein
MAPKKGGHISRLEPEGVELLEAFSPKSCRSLRMQGGSSSIVHSRVTMKKSPCFSHINFDGFETMVGNVLIHVTKHSIGAACRLSVYGEWWWKKEMIPVDLVNQFYFQNIKTPTGVRAFHING